MFFQLSDKEKNIQSRFLLIVAGLLLSALSIFSEANSKQEPLNPNIVIILMDNFGWGELGVYGGGVLLGAPTTRIDQLAAQGMRLTNFNVETICTTSRAALMTGRYAIRTGSMYPWYTTKHGLGLVQWEVTLAEMLNQKGYVSGIFGKWHLGDAKGRYPTDQGFDEWYGIPNTSDESGWESTPHYDSEAHPLARRPYIMQGKRGQSPKKITPFDSKQRILIDEEITNRAIDFMARKHNKGEKFFAYIPYTQAHHPAHPHPDFKGKTGNGDRSDVLAQIDHYVGKLLDAVDQLGIRNDTIFIFTSDNGSAYSGLWRGDGGGLSTANEGALRVPFIIRWPDYIPSNTVSNEIVHQIDIFPMLARIVGADIPEDRIIDGIDQTNFFFGHQEKSNREGFVIYAEEKILGVKYRNWKMLTTGSHYGEGTPRVHNLFVNPKEYKAYGSPIADYWVRFPAGQILKDHLESLDKYPPIPAGTPDPYIPDY